MATTPNAGFSLGPTRRFTEAVSDTVVAYNLIGARGAVSLIFMRDGDGWTGADLGIHQPLPAPTGRACHLLGELHCSYDGSSPAEAGVRSSSHADPRMLPPGLPSRGRAATGSVGR